MKTEVEREKTVKKGEWGKMGREVSGSQKKEEKKFGSYSHSLRTYNILNDVFVAKVCKTIKRATNM
jgi:hypothetical protein